MVLYFTSVCEADGKSYMLYMGRDKEENELLIKFGWPEDVWFHADHHSSAHVYVRLPKGMTIDQLPDSVIEDAAQLTKENSISGKKLPRLKIVYTPWSNLRKGNAMEVGQVGFHKESLRSYKKVDRNKAIVDRLYKTKLVKDNVDFEGEKLIRDKEEQAEKRVEAVKREEESRRIAKQRAEEKEARSYDQVFDEANMKSNTTNAQDYEDYEDNFM